MPLPPTSSTASSPLRDVPPRAHPLEAIPLFRRWQPSKLRDLVYTALYSSLLGLAIVLFEARIAGSPVPSAADLGETLLVANLIGFPIHAGLVLLRRLRPSLPPQRIWVAALAAVALYVGSTLFGLAAGALLFGHGSVFDSTLQAVRANLATCALVSGVMVAVLASIERRLVREKLAALKEGQIAEAGRLLAEARLRALQAQIEPHFLYNTLANVVSLIDPHPERARHMLERLIDFLRASLAASRAGQATLGAEFDLAAAYLDLLTVRFGTRLRYRIELDAASRTLPLSPMLIQPLVENAVMHGIEPALNGGEIVVRARVEAGAGAGRLIIEVADDGAGLGDAAPRPGGGVGLANLRERLRSLHGPDARLELFENPGGGVTARLTLPLSSSMTEESPSPPSAP